VVGCGAPSAGHLRGGGAAGLLGSGAVVVLWNACCVHGGPTALHLPGHSMLVGHR